MTRPQSSYTTNGDPFLLGDKSKSYQHQFANLYFMRLSALRKGVLARAQSKWGQTDGAHSVSYFSVQGLIINAAKHVKRVLDVEKGEQAFIVGTTYMEMRLKPNVLDDIGKDVRAYVTT